MNGPGCTQVGANRIVDTCHPSAVGANVASTTMPSWTSGTYSLAVMPVRELPAPKATHRPAARRIGCTTWA